MSKAPFPFDPVMTAIVIAYKNKRMIADDIAPRFMVGRPDFKYLKHNLAEGFTVPDTFVGRKSKPNQVEFTAVEQTDSCADYALDDIVPQFDIDVAPENYNPLNRAVEGLADLIALAREKRVADLVQDAAQYGSNTVALSGSDRFDDSVGSDPIEVIVNSLDAMIMRGNIMTIGRKAFSTLARHPKILKAVHGNSGDAGIATRQAIASLFELEEIFVGEAFLNIAKKNEAPVLTRTWGNHISLQYRDLMANPLGSRMTFIGTAQFGSAVAGSTTEFDAGMRGGVKVRAGESVKELIFASELGYFIQNVIS